MKTIFNLTDIYADENVKRFSTEEGLIQYFRDNFETSLPSGKESGELRTFDTVEDCKIFIENYGGEYLSLRTVELNDDEDVSIPSNVASAIKEADRARAQAKHLMCEYIKAMVDKFGSIERNIEIPAEDILILYDGDGNPEYANAYSLFHGLYKKDGQYIIDCEDGNMYLETADYDSLCNIAYAVNSFVTTTEEDWEHD